MKNKKHNTLNPNYDVEQGRREPNFLADILAFGLLALVALSALFILSRGA